MASGLFNLKQVNQAISQGAWSGYIAPRWVEYLVVAGGGGGGSGSNLAGGGGGAGGLLTGIVTVAAGTSYTVTVGSGGSGGAGNSVGGIGVASVFGSISSTGGGYGSQYNGTTSVVGNGGSGGGGSAGISALVTGQGIAGQGNAGGAAVYTTYSYPSCVGGGGGAGTAGLPGPAQNIAGNGGAGIASAISGPVVTYAGGGGGGAYTGVGAAYTGTGGVGGGGNGGSTGGGTFNAGAGATNTGGGGGGAGFGATGGAGGSGIVVVRYPGNVVFFTGGTVNYNNGYIIHIFTSNGTLAPTAPTVYNTSYQISRSLRFNSADSAYLNRTPASATNRRTWTWSAWVKRGSGFGDRQNVFGASTSDFNTDTHIELYEANQLRLVDYVSATNMELVTTQVFRDPSAWYHFVVAVDTTQATASNRAKIYVNGSQVTSFTIATYPSQNFDTQINNTISHGVGRAGAFNGQYFNGYQTDVYLIDGQALTPSSFGATSTTTGVWSPIQYTGTYGTNGFYLNFSDNSNTTAATLGKDYSGNGNNWTPNGFFVTAGAGNDSLVDSPTSYGVDTGVGGTVRGNYCTINPLAKLNWQSQGGTLTPYNGNLQFDGSSVGAMMDSTIAVRSGKWYWEITQVNNMLNGIRATRGIPTGDMTYRYYQTSGEIVYTPYNSATTQVLTFAATATSGDIIGIALDLDNSTISWYKNNTLLYTATSIVADEYTPCVGNAAAMTGAFINFGQRPFAYTAPSGFLALCTQNLPTPTIGATSNSLATQFFNPVLYTGTGSDNRAVTGVGFQPDFVWVKGRDIGQSHVLNNAVAGVGTAKTLYSNLTVSQGTYDDYGYLQSLDTDGYTIKNGSINGNLVNASGYQYVAWNWKANGSGSSNSAGSITSTVSANTTSGFSVVTYTGNATSGATVGHGLGVAPSMVIVKRRDSATNWVVYNSNIGATKYLYLNLTDAAGTYSGFWNNTAPTSSVFSLGNDATTNASAGTFVAYCFVPVAGFSAFGSYTGNGSTDGPFVFTGMRPAYIMVKGSSSATNWIVEDTTRSTTNVIDARLFPDSSEAELSNGNGNIDFLSNGFKLRNAHFNMNASGVTYIFMAFASSPFKYSLAR